MSFLISYNRKEVLQALRYHFIKQSEIKGLMIAVNIYAIVTAVLLFQKKIRPELFLFGSVLWLILMLLFWYLLPIIFYKKTKLFKSNWNFSYSQQEATLVSEHAEAQWQWSELTYYFESPYFFHLYFGLKSFFLISKETIPMEHQHELRGILKQKHKDDKA